MIFNVRTWSFCKTYTRGTQAYSLTKRTLVGYRVWTVLKLRKLPTVSMQTQAWNGHDHVWSCLTTAFNSECSLCKPLSFYLIYSLTVRVVRAPQMILQPVSSISSCSRLPSGIWRTPGLSIPWHCLPTSSCLPCLLPPFTVPCRSQCWSAFTRSPCLIGLVFKTEFCLFIY